MNKHFKKVQSVLKTKASSFGFTKKELESVAESISDNLTLEDDATEEEVNEAIESAVNSAIPFLKISQSASNRVIQAYKDAHKDDDDDDDDDDEPTVKTQKKPKPRHEGNDEKNELMDLLKSFKEDIGSVKSELAAIKEGKTKDKRLEKVKSLVAGTGSYEKSVLRNFGRMTFQDDDDFDEFLDEVKNGLDDYNNERVSAGLDELTPPANGGKRKRETDDEPFSDDDIDKIGASMN